MNCIFSWFFSTGLLLFTMDVFAFNCFEASPNLTLLKDEYWENNNPLELKKVADEFEWLPALTGRWNGTVTETVCKGSDARPREIVHQGEVRVEISVHNKSLLDMHMKKSFPARKLTQIERVSLLVKNRLLSLEATEQQLTAVERYHQKLATNDATRYVETIADIHLDGESLTIVWSLFSNGVYAFSQSLTLQRR